MSLRNIPAGENIPEDVYVIIEITSRSTNSVKYEINKKSNVLFVDRIMPTAMFYPFNYGYINNTLSLDGDPIDAIVIFPYCLQPMSVIKCRPIGALNMEDEKGKDTKIVVVPHTEIYTYYDDIKNVSDLSNTTLSQISHFFEQYKALEKNKWVKIKDWYDADLAKVEIVQSFNRAKKNKIY